MFLAWAVVVAQMEEQLLPAPEVCGSNPVIEDGNKEKETGSGIFKNQQRKILKNKNISLEQYIDNDLL